MSKSSMAAAENTLMLDGTSARDSSRLRAVTTTVSSTVEADPAAEASSAHEVPGFTAEPQIATRPSRRLRLWNGAFDCLQSLPSGPQSRNRASALFESRNLDQWASGPVPRDQQCDRVRIDELKAHPRIGEQSAQCFIRSQRSLERLTAKLRHKSDAKRICRPACWANSLSASASGSREC